MIGIAQSLHPGRLHTLNGGTPGSLSLGSRMNGDVVTKLVQDKGLSVCLVLVTDLTWIKSVKGRPLELKGQASPSLWSVNAPLSTLHSKMQ